MAQKRMFSIKVVDTDRFLDMSTTAQCLYFHLGMRADDDGFVASPKRIIAMCGCNPDDLRLLIAKGFVYAFESGICAITDWRLNNTLKGDRYAPTLYEEEKAMLLAQHPLWFQTGSKLVPQNRKEEDRKGKKSTPAGKPPRPPFLPPSAEEVGAYCRERGNAIDPEQFLDFYAAKGWMIGKNKMKDWRAAVRSWERRDRAAAPPTERPPLPPTGRLEIIDGQEVYVIDGDNSP